MLALTYFEVAFYSVLIWAVSVAVYQIYFHPLAKFPGPKLAALSTWYEGYYDVIKSKGRFTWELARLHEQYGEFGESYLKFRLTVRPRIMLFFFFAVVQRLSPDRASPWWSNY
jgi:hypothetical protein